MIRFLLKTMGATVLLAAASSAVLAQAQYQEQIHPRVRNLDPKEKIVLKLLLLKGGEITPKDIGDEFMDTGDVPFLSGFMKICYN